MEYSDYEAAKKRVDQRLAKKNAFKRGLLVFNVVIIVSWTLWNGGLTFGWVMPWPVLLTLVWLGGLLKEGVSAHFRADARPERVDKELFRRMEKMYGPDWHYEADEAVYQALRYHISARVNRRIEVLETLVSFPPAAVFLFLLWDSGLTFGLDFPWPVIIVLLWLIGLLLMTLRIFAGPGVKRYQKEIEKELALRDEKRKLAEITDADDEVYMSDERQRYARQ
jgi:hypothetical protein